MLLFQSFMYQCCCISPLCITAIGYIRYAASYDTVVFFQIMYGHLRELKYCTHATASTIIIWANANEALLK